MGSTSLWALILSTGLVPAAVTLANEAESVKITFGKESLGKVPTGWAAVKTGQGEGSIWKVVADGSTPSKSGFVLAQTAESPSAMFNLCVLQDGNFKDVELQVAFKSIKGQKDQGGGFVWRYQDPNNYYVARFNTLEDNYRLYHVVNGKRTQFGGKEDTKIPTGEWHTLKVTQIGDSIKCYLDDKLLIDAKDSTFTMAGKVGLWTKADAQTYFDDFRANDFGK